LEVRELKYPCTELIKVFIPQRTIKKRLPRPIALISGLTLLLGVVLLCTCRKGSTIPDIAMVRIPGGEFMMGSETGLVDERPVHRVRVDSFYLGRTEVTVAQWRMFVRDSGYLSRAERGLGGLVRTDKGLKIMPDATWNHPYMEQTDDHPVVLVSWKDARAFCIWLSKKSGLRYRLPTEAEWEYACKAGGKDERYGDLDTVTWYEYNSGGHTHPVGSKRPNAFGLYDMLGNVWEWCQDRYGRKYYRVSPEINPAGPAIGLQRVSRGGSWCSKPPRIRAAFRRHDSASFSFYRLGFRIARTEPSGNVSNIP
jgi:formylglycine-generating enzyme required for sulfatase activity